jgi:alanyl-tRNA synthetase
MQAMEATLGGVAGTLKVLPTEVPNRVNTLLDQVRRLERELAATKGKLASSQGDDLATQAIEVAGIKVLVATLEGADVNTLRETMDKLKDKLKSAAIVLASVNDGKVSLAAGVTPDLIAKIKAGELVNFVAQQIGGKGGGKPDMAMAGGTDASQLPNALASVEGWLKQKI